MKPYDPLGLNDARDYADIESIPIGKEGIMRGWRVSSLSRRILSLNTAQKLIRVEFDQPRSLVLSFVESQKIVFDYSSPKATVTILEYSQALDAGSLVDMVVKRESQTAIRGYMFWSHVVYRNENLRYDEQRFRGRRARPDGLWAYLLANVNKLERQAARWLRLLRHDPHGPALDGDGSFPVVIDYAGDVERARELDLWCAHCRERFEVRAVQHELYKRFSHSSIRPVWGDPSPDGYALLVQPTGSIRAFSIDVLSRIVRRLPEQERKQFDRNAELPPIVTDTLALSEEQIGCLA